MPFIGALCYNPAILVEGIPAMKMKFAGCCILGCLIVAVGCGGGSSNENDLGADVPGDIAAGDTVTGDTVNPDVPVDTAPETTEPIPIDWEAFLHPEGAGFPQDGKKRVMVLHTNDIHSHVNGTGPVLDYTPETIMDDDTIGGFARIASLIERQKAWIDENVGMAIMDAGDFSFGTAFTALAPTTGLELRMMDEMGYVATTIGNHELDWTPEGLVEVLNHGLEAATNISVISSNLVYSDESAEDDAMAALVGDKIKPYKVVTLENGVKIGMFGLLGVNAIKLSPNAEPVTARALKETALEMVDTLRNVENVDLVIALSHSGVSEGTAKGEDEALAEQVDGIDIIVSGHTHTYMAEPIIVKDTVIVQSACYGKFLGRLVMVQDGQGGWDLESWEPIPITDEIPGWPAMIETVQDYMDMLGDTAFASLGIGYADPIATTGFDLVPVEFKEYSLGNLIADGVRYSAAKFSGREFDVAFEANGVIRDSLLKGKSGKITLGDIVQVVPLGIGPDGDMGYPIIEIYMTAGELKTALEIIVGVAVSIADSFFLQISGLKFEYKGSADWFYKVTRVYMADGNGGWLPDPLDTSEANTKLYRVATNLYIGEMLGVVKEYLGGMVSLEPKNAEGVPYEHISDAIMDIDPDTAGIQELKLWRAFYQYLADMAIPDGATLPAIPAEYGTDMGRMKAVP